MWKHQTSGIDFYAGVAQLIERCLAMAEVCGFEPRHPLKGNCHCFRHRYGGTHKPKRTFLDSKYESRTANTSKIFHS